MPFSAAVDNSVIGAFVGKTDWARTVDEFWVGLSIGTATKSSPGTEVTESGYARKQIIGSKFNAPASSATTTNAVVTFDQALADWGGGGDIVNAIFFTAVTGGTYLGWDDMPLKPVLTGDTASFAAGDIDVSMT